MRKKSNLLIIHSSIHSLFRSGPITRHPSPVTRHEEVIVITADFVIPLYFADNVA